MRLCVVVYYEIGIENNHKNTLYISSAIMQKLGTLTYGFKLTAFCATDKLPIQMCYYVV